MDERFWLSSTFSFEHSQLSQHDHFPLNGQVQVQDTPFLFFKNQPFIPFHVMSSSKPRVGLSIALGFRPFFVRRQSRPFATDVWASSLDHWINFVVLRCHWAKKIKVDGRNPAEPAISTPRFFGSRNLGGDFWKNTVGREDVLDDEARLLDFRTIYLKVKILSCRELMFQTWNLLQFWGHGLRMFNNISPAFEMTVDTSAAARVDVQPFVSPLTSHTV